MADELVTELRQQRETIQEQLETTRTLVSELQGRVRVLEQHEQTVTGLREIVGDGDLVQRVREMRVVVDEYTRTQRQQQIAEAVTQAMGDIANNERGAQLIREMVGNVETPDAARARVAELLEREYVQGMLRALVIEQAGPGAIVRGAPGNMAHNWRDDIASKADDIARSKGLSRRN